MRKTGFIYSEDYLNHDTGLHHPERGGRLRAILKEFKNSGLLHKITQIVPKEASREQVFLAHSRDYIKSVEDICSKIAENGHLDMDTVISAKSYKTALLAAGGVISAVDSVLDGEIDNAFCAVRPPGHHAESDKGMGFCIFNNAAIGARYALTKCGVERVFIFDFDAHHGNGTQNAFYNDSSVFYASIHQSPYYPYTGSADETGEGEGRFSTLNIPLPAGSGEEEYMKVVKNDIYNAIISYKPQMIILSAGFDAHIKDPLSGLSLSSEAFGKMTEILTEAADIVCNGRIVSVLEGGYSLNALAESVRYHVAALCSDRV